MSESIETTPLDGVATSTLENLREALIRNGTRTPRRGGEVHLAVRSLSVEARAAGVPVEQVIIQLKRTLHALGVEGPSLPRKEGSTVTQRLVSFCLDEYFAEE